MKREGLTESGPTEVGQIAITLIRELSSQLPEGENLSMAEIDGCWKRAFAAGRAGVLINEAKAKRPEGSVLNERELYEIDVQAYAEHGLVYPEPKGRYLREACGLE